MQVTYLQQRATIWLSLSNCLATSRAPADGEIRLAGIWASSDQSGSPGRGTRGRWTVIGAVEGVVAHRLHDTARRDRAGPGTSSPRHVAQVAGGVDSERSVHWTHPLGPCVVLAAAHGHASPAIGAVQGERVWTDR